MDGPSDQWWHHINIHADMVTTWHWPHHWPHQYCVHPWTWSPLVTITSATSQFHQSGDIHILSVRLYAVRGSEIYEDKITKPSIMYLIQTGMTMQFRVHHIMFQIITHACFCIFQIFIAIMYV